jgi:hypothetical protein
MPIDSKDHALVWTVLGERKVLGPSIGSAHEKFGDADLSGILWLDGPEIKATNLNLNSHPPGLGWE